MSSEGLKFDDKKLRWSLLPLRELEDVVKVLEIGAKKYAEENWKCVENGPQRYLDAAFRHLIAYANGEHEDEETGISHLAHLVCNSLFIMWFKNQECSVHLDNESSQDLGTTILKNGELHVFREFLSKNGYSQPMSENQYSRFAEQYDEALADLAVKILGKTF